MHWQDLIRSELFGWFGVTESHRSTGTDGTLVYCKPGGNQDAIDLVFTLDGAEQVGAALLVMDRAWMDGRASAPFAADLTKSFLLVVAADDPLVRQLGEEIGRLIPTLPGVISRSSDSPQTPTPGPTSLIDAYFGRRRHAELLGITSALAVDNAEPDDPSGNKRGPRCAIRWRLGNQALNRSQ